MSYEQVKRWRIKNKERWNKMCVKNMKTYKDRLKSNLQRLTVEEILARVGYYENNTKTSNKPKKRV